MEYNRRRVLQITGPPLSSMVLAGCVSPTNPRDGDDSGERNQESLRVDDPPYELTEPDCTETDERDPLWLCEKMPTDPSVAFEQVETSSVIFADEGLNVDEQQESDQYYATFLTEASDRDRLHDDISESVVNVIEETGFDSEAVLVAQTGWGSGSVTPHLKRIEEADDGIHAFGCYRRPCQVTMDQTVRTVVARFARPASLDGSIVSLTVDPETRVHFEVQNW